MTQQCVKWTFHNRACWRGCLLSSDDMGGPTAAAYQWGPPARSLKRRVGRVSGDIGKVLCSWRTVDQCRVLSARNLSSRYTPRSTVRYIVRARTCDWAGNEREVSRCDPMGSSCREVHSLPTCRGLPSQRSACPLTGAAVMPELARQPCKRGMPAVMCTFTRVLTLGDRA